jgi:hypothetical protein
MLSVIGILDFQERSLFARSVSAKNSDKSPSLLGRILFGIIR